MLTGRCIFGAKAQHRGLASSRRGGPYHTGCSETRGVGGSPQQTVLMEKQHIRMVPGKETDAAA